MRSLKISRKIGWTRKVGEKAKQVENKNGPGQLCQKDMARVVRGKKSSLGSCVAEVSQQEASHTYFSAGFGSSKSGKRPVSSSEDCLFVGSLLWKQLLARSWRIYRWAGKMALWLTLLPSLSILETTWQEGRTDFQKLSSNLHMRYVCTHKTVIKLLIEI